MMPSRSPAWTSRLTARTAVRPPKRLVTDSSVSTVPPRTPPRGDARHAFRREPHDEDQHDAVDDQVDAGEARLDAGEGRAQVRLERGDEQRAEERPQRGAHAADDAVEREADGEVDREDVRRVHEADVLRPQAAAHGGEGGADHDRLHLAAAGGDAERLGGVLVLAHAGQLVADARALEIDLKAVADQREPEDQVEPGDVAEPQRPEPGPERDRHALRARGEAAPAAGDDLENFREGDRGEREVRAPE